MGLQRAGRCTDSSFTSGILVIGGGHVTRRDGEAVNSDEGDGLEEGSKNAEEGEQQ